jgi:NAD(P)-dependent dehydrogenase (short-subunit alcohol dehydrogenase family)
MARLKGKVALVTGAASGLGRASAQRLASEGAVVACVDLNTDAVDPVVKDIEDAGGRALALAADVGSSEALDAAVGRTVKAFGSLDICLANAGIASAASATELSHDAWDRVIAINLTGVWRTCRAVLPQMMAAGGGSLIAQASIGGIIGIPSQAAYAAAKGGVIALVRQMAVDYARFGIRVNAIAPGTVMTPLVERHWAALAGADELPDDAIAAAVAHYPLGRLGTPGDIAAAVAYLASEDAAWVTGTVLVVDGGRTAS